MNKDFNWHYHVDVAKVESIKSGKTCDVKIKKFEQQEYYSSHGWMNPFKYYDGLDYELYYKKGSDWDTVFLVWPEKRGFICWFDGLQDRDLVDYDLKNYRRDYEGFYNKIKSFSFKELIEFLFQFECWQYLYDYDTESTIYSFRPNELQVE